MAKKSQYAVTVILIGMIVLFAIYTILAYPEERARMLNISIPNETNITTSPLGEGTTLIFSSGEIAEIGRSSGESVFSFNLDNFYVAYPIKEKTLDSKDITLKASILKSESSYFDANNLNLENTKDVVLRLNITSISGNPTLTILLNTSKIFERRITQIGELNVIIPKGYLHENNPITLKLKHNGVFWASNSLSSSVKVIQNYYNPENPTAEQVVTLGQSNIKGNELRISLTPTKAIPNGDIIIKVNDKILFSGKLEENKTFAISKRLDDCGIHVGENTISFEADKGGVYNLTNVKLEFVAVSTPAANKVYSFDVPSNYLNSTNDIILGIRVDKIIKPGYINARLNDGPTYYFENSDLASGAWSYTVLDKAYLNELGNKITVDSTNGRYRVTGLVVIAK